MWRVRFNLTVTVHELDDVYENHRSIWMTVAANRLRFRHRICRVAVVLVLPKNTNLWCCW